MISSILGFFTGGIKWFRIIAVLAVFAAIGGSVYAAYRYTENLQEENRQLTQANATLQSNVQQLQSAVQTQNETFEELQRDYERQAEILSQTNQDFQEARDQVTDLREKLSEHDLGYLAYSKPGLVENIINDATDEINRCFEIASGSPLTQEEINATLPSEINSECPELANPNYQDDQ